MLGSQEVVATYIREKKGGGKEKKLYIKRDKEKMKDWKRIKIKSSRNNAWE